MNKGTIIYISVEELASTWDESFEALRLSDYECWRFFSGISLLGPHQVNLDREYLGAKHYGISYRDLERDLYDNYEGRIYNGSELSKPIYVSGVFTNVFYLNSNRHKVKITEDSEGVVFTNAPFFDRDPELFETLVSVDLTDGGIRCTDVPCKLVIRRTLL